MADELTFLVVRGEDFVLLGLRTMGFEFAGDGVPASPPMLEATTDDARVVLTFPPQAMAEEVLAPSTLKGFRPAAVLGGSSRVGFTMARGARLALSVEGILAALRGSRILPGSNPPLGDDTAVEMPWHMVVSPESLSPAGHVTCDHPTQPVSAPSHVVGLWRTRLLSSDAGGRAGRMNASLAIRPIDRELAESLDPGFATEDAFGPLFFPFDVPLTQANRTSIFQRGQTEPPRADRLELSSLGGSLSAGRVWDGFEWEHRANVGRDMWVRTVTKGVLYPFGHQAVFEELTERVIGPDSTEPVAGLCKVSTLVVTEPVRGRPGADELRRAFPFDQVEITTRTFSGLRPPEWQAYHRPTTPELAALQERLHALQTEEGELQSVVNIALRPPATTFELSESGLPGADRAVRLMELNGRIEELLQFIEPIREALNAAEDQRASLQRQLDDLLQEPVGPDGISPFQDQINELTQMLANIPFPDTTGLREAEVERADLINNQVPPVQRDVDFFLQRVPTVDDVAGSTLAQADEAIRILDIQRREIPEVKALIAPLQDAASEEVNVFFWPEVLIDPSSGGAEFHPTGGKLMIPVRCTGRNNDVSFALPMIFVADERRGPVGDMPAFESLTDAGVAALLDHEWRSERMRSVTLPGVPVDVVQGAVQQPGDVHEVGEFTIERSAPAGVFWPAVTEFKVALPVLRTLLNEEEHVAVAYTEEFLRAGEVEEVALRVAGGAAIDVDFTKQADRAGGLISPKVEADVISRLHGPVNGEGLRNLDAAKMFGEGATLLGFPIQDLVKDLRAPPAMNPILEDGLPTGVQMKWEGVDLVDNHGPFLKTPRTKLDLIVESSPSRSLTTCIVNEFSLAFPEGQEDPLLKLTFDSLVYIQEAGHPARIGSLRAPRAPGQDPQVGPLKVKAEFGAQLNLLKELQNAIDLGSSGPNIDVDTSGLKARYALPVPEVSAGAFVMRNIVVHAGVDVPFDTSPDLDHPEGKAVSVRLAFATREKPFNLSVSLFGGGGYIDVEIDKTGVRRLDASLEFGAAVAVNFVVGSAEVHALGGIRYFEEPDGSVGLDGYIRIGGSVEVLGLVSVSVELLVVLRYEPNRLVGRATLLIEIDLTLYSDTVELDSGEWVLAGGTMLVAERGLLVDSDRSEETDGAPRLADWQAYRRAFVTP